MASSVVEPVDDGGGAAAIGLWPIILLWLKVGWEVYESLKEGGCWMNDCKVVTFFLARPPENDPGLQ